MTMLRLPLFALALLSAVSVGARPGRADDSQVFGPWLTESKRGVVDIFPCGDKVCGKLVWMIEPIRRGAPAVDDYNPTPELRQRPLCGLVMLGDFHETAPKHWEDGWIYDPDSGKTYRANMTLEENGMLRLRGYVGIPLFGESQHWTRADGSRGKCQQDSPKRQ
jgi:uncharacterized protein (DUF2147 family)